MTDADKKSPSLGEPAETRAVPPLDDRYIPERDGRRCVDHPTGDHELVCLTCMEDSESEREAAETSSVVNIAAWKCKHCGCIWRDNLDGTVSLFDAQQQSCRECEESTPHACVIHWIAMAETSAVLSPAHDLVTRAEAAEAEIVTLKAANRQLQAMLGIAELHVTSKDFCPACGRNYATEATS